MTTLSPIAKPPFGNARQVYDSRNYPTHIVWELAGGDYERIIRTLDSALRLLGEGEPIPGVVYGGRGLAGKRASLVDDGTEDWHCEKQGAQRLYTVPPVPPAVVVPEGMALVPIEPTEAMRRAAQVADMDHSDPEEWDEDEWPDHLRIYHAMLNAHPERTNG